jgi:hypothetical protein
MTTDRLDPKARKILFDTFWKNGWIDSAHRQTPPADFAYAKAHGLMFDPLTISHDALIARLDELKQRIPPHKAAQAFLCSLSTRRLDWRSSLASWNFAQDWPVHAFDKRERLIGTSYDVNGNAIEHRRCECALCSGSAHYQAEDLNVLNFERLRWGGVRHGKLPYLLLDLEGLDAATLPQPTTEDLRLFQVLLDTVATSAPKDTPSKLRERLRQALPGNKDEIGILIEILACAGVLHTHDTKRSGQGDWVFAALWRGADGYEQAAVDKLFGIHLPA